MKQSFFFDNLNNIVNNKCRIRDANLFACTFFSVLLWRKKAVMNLNIGEASPVKAVQHGLWSWVQRTVTTVHCMAGGGHIGRCVTLDI